VKAWLVPVHRVQDDLQQSTTLWSAALSVCDWPESVNLGHIPCVVHMGRSVYLSIHPHVSSPDLLIGFD